MHEYSFANTSVQTKQSFPQILSSENSRWKSSYQWGFQLEGRNLSWRAVFIWAGKSFPRILLVVGVPTALIYLGLGLVWAVEDNALNWDWIPFVALYACLACVVWMTWSLIKLQWKNRD
jgi:hypothetical protein